MVTETEQPVENTTEEQGRFELVSRVLEYPAVGYVSESLKNGYNYVKESNSYVKAGLETAESLSVPVLQKLDDISKIPIVESILTSADNYGCEKLDKLEERGAALKSRVESVKPNTIEKIDNLADQIHGTKTENVMFFSLGLVDAIIDSLLPAQSEQEETYRVGTEDPNVVDAAGPVYNKLKARVSRDSLRKLPLRTYTEMRDLVFRSADSVPQVQYCIGVLMTAAHRAQETGEAAKNGIQKGVEMSKNSADSIYQSLTHMVPVLGSIVEGAKKLDPHEAKATLAELSSMIAKSREDVTNMLTAENTRQAASRIKTDIASIMRRGGDYLSENLAAGIERAAASDNVAIRKAADSLDSIVSRVVDGLPVSPSTPSINEEVTGSSSQ